MAEKTLLYVIGPSGSGKTTALRLALAGIPYTSEDTPVQHIVYEGGAIQLGVAREPFGGTDGMPLDVNPRAIAFLAETDARVVIAEGDRLANRRFFMGALEAGWQLTIAYIELDEETAARRRAKRGSPASASWAKGRHTKVRNLAKEWGRFVWRIDGRRSPEEIAQRLMQHTAIQQARGKVTE